MEATIRRTFRVRRFPMVQPDDPAIRFVSLTQEKFAIVDAEDHEALTRFTWWAFKTHDGNFYAVRKVTSGEKRIQLPMSNAILGLDPGVIVDHIDGNSLNYRRMNLRETSRAGNAKNRKMQSNNTSGVPGVSMVPRTTRWRADIKHKGRRIYLGSFATKEEAQQAYQGAAGLYHGEFVRE